MARTEPDPGGYDLVRAIELAYVDDGYLQWDRKLNQFRNVSKIDKPSVVQAHSDKGHLTHM